MAYYSSPEEMFSKRAERSKRDGDRHWAMAKNGEGDHHYGKAKTCYKYAALNQEKADNARANGETWSKKQ